MTYSLLSHLAIAGVIASSPAAPSDIPPVPQLSPQTAVSTPAPSRAPSASTPTTTTVVVEVPEAPAEQAHVVVGQAPSSIRAAQEQQDQGGKVDDMQVLSGIDISSHQHNPGVNMNIKEVVAGGQDFGFVKATEGTHYTNPYFRSDVISFINESTPVGFYHYARPTDSTDNAREQAQRFVKTTGMDIGVKALPPVLDLEESEGLKPEQLVAWTQAFVDEVKTLTGRDTMIYTYPNFWRNEMGNTTKFNHLPLWIAHYNNQGDPGDLPGGWNDWEFWQYSSKGKISGVDAQVDVNIYSKDKKDLDALYVASKNGRVLESSSPESASVPAPPTITVDTAESSSTQMGSVKVPESASDKMPQLKSLLDAFAHTK